MIVKVKSDHRDVGTCSKFFEFPTGTSKKSRDKVIKKWLVAINSTWSVINVVRLKQVTLSKKIKFKGRA